MLYLTINVLKCANLFDIILTLLNFSYFYSSWFFYLICSDDFSDLYLYYLLFIYDLYLIYIFYTKINNIISLIYKYLMYTIICVSANVIYYLTKNSLSGPYTDIPFSRSMAMRSVMRRHVRSCRAGKNRKPSPGIVSVRV